MTSPGFTLLGLPTVHRARSKRRAASAQLDARLWDVLPSGKQRLISRGVYRLAENQTGTITFQLHGNGYEFAAGDTVKLELLGRDAPYYRASNGAFTIEAQQPDGLAADALSALRNRRVGLPVPARRRAARRRERMSPHATARGRCRTTRSATCQTSSSRPVTAPLPATSRRRPASRGRRRSCCRSGGGSTRTSARSATASQPRASSRWRRTSTAARPRTAPTRPSRR